MQRVSDKLLSWASDIEPDTLEQALRLSRMPFVQPHVALMPDAHLGMGATVGSVIATQGALIPAAVGVDLGCGMLAVNLGGFAPWLVEDLTKVLQEISYTIPAGVGQGHETRERGVVAVDEITAEVWRTKDTVIPKSHFDRLRSGPLFETAVSQFGSLGSGNHFLEICTDERDNYWVVVHSGSRGVGNKLAQGYIKTAQEFCKKSFIELEDPDLAYLVEGTPEFDNYVADVTWAQLYAWRNRERMMELALAAIWKVQCEEEGCKEPCVPDPHVLDEVHCHHNYTSLENHMGQGRWITRKGAVAASVLDRSVLPGSMGTDTYIVRGNGNVESFRSAPHGAGRRLSRRRAKRELSLETLHEKMNGRVWLEDDAVALLDEHPDAYKDITQVLEDAKDLVTVQHTLTPILNYKGI